MRDIGVRLARQKLLRYREPAGPGARWRGWLVLAVGVWGAWVLLLSDHSVSRLLQLKSKRDRMGVELDRARHDLHIAQKQVPSANPTPEEAERLLRERHNYARDGELIYVIGDDTTKSIRTRRR